MQLPPLHVAAFRPVPANRSMAALRPTFPLLAISAVVRNPPVFAVRWREQNVRFGYGVVTVITGGDEAD